MVRVVPRRFLPTLSLYECIIGYNVQSGISEDAASPGTIHSREVQKYSRETDLEDDVLVFAAEQVSATSRLLDSAIRDFF